MAAEQAAAAELQLPLGAVTKSDVGRLADETEALDNFLRQAAVREPGSPVQLPKVSKLFDEIVEINKLNLLQEPERTRLLAFLQQIRTQAPTLHVSFSTDPSPVFQQRLVSWIRKEMHPYVLLQIGLQPSIGAGCTVRSTNKYFDFSLRKRFSTQHEQLVAQLVGVPTVAPAAPTSQVPVATGAAP